MRTPKLVKLSGINNHLAEMELGDGQYEYKFHCTGKKTINVLGYDQVILTVKSDEINEWKLSKQLISEFNGISVQPWQGGYK